MTRPFPVKSAAALMDASFDARWLDRSRIGPAARITLRAILDAFVAQEGPVDIASLDNDAAVAELDERDLIFVSEGRVHLAYPFAGTPTDFVAVLRAVTTAARPSRSRWRPRGRWAETTSWPG
jgi:hypothetical protein